MPVEKSGGSLMRVLYITPYLPDTLRTRPFNLLLELARRHEITLLSPIFSLAEAQATRQLSQQIPGLVIKTVFCPKLQSLSQCLVALGVRQPMQARYCYSTALIEAAWQLIKASRFDLIHIEHFRAAYLGRELSSAGLPTVYDAVDSISLLVERTWQHGPVRQRAISRLELAATRRYERHLMRTGYFQKVCATSREDAAALEQLAGLPEMTGQVEVVPNGVDTGVFCPPPPGIRREPATVVFSGKMSYHSNAAAARYLVREIWPLVRRARHDAQLWIVGSRPPRDLQAYAGRNGVEVTGYVPDLRDYLQRATVAAAPLVYSVGIQNKVLEAMACATPTIATGQVSRAIRARDGQELCLVPAGQPGEFAHRIVELIEDPRKAGLMGQAGRDFVLSHYTWQNAARQIEELWAGVQSKPHPGQLAGLVS
jgi:glycosyltransferase involved in cell wall biosynthesis